MDDSDLGGQVAGSIARHLGGYVSGMLLAAGAISPDQKTQSAAICASVIGYLLVQGWSVVRKWRRAQRAS